VTAIDASAQVFKALADASRLRILAALLEEPRHVEVLAERLELSASTVSFHLKKLESAGLVTSERDQYHVVYRPVGDLLDQTLRDFVRLDARDARAQGSREEAYRRKVLRAFFACGKLKSIPVQRKKRRIVLEQLLQVFEEGRDYTEREVNVAIADYHDDFCTLRRELILEKLMRRQGGIYRRT
jgi:DNA-binding HxlR family transcriptional regulator